MTRERPDPALPDPAALRSERMVRFFSGVMRRAMRRSFHGVRIAAPGIPEVPADKPVLVYCNHPSWWDAAFLIVLAGQCFPDRRGFGPMDARALQQYGFMKRIGLFPVVPDTPAGAIAFMKTATRLLEDPASMLWVTAQGRFTDVRVRPAGLRGGLAHLILRHPRLTILPLALEYAYWDEKLPEALCRFGTAIDGAAFSDLPVTEWQALLELRLTDTMDALAADAMARDPAAFQPLLEGRTGIGGIYDLWRRARHWTRGKRFDPSHSAATRRGGDLP
ncbi:lysophospholipid acyltransferase family protein [Indioceanicola profundi]|uniref:lysophospholipid acyltransferase family protein n=1 Tax=Indioceanicola profundi TaxID=2220096 RepID=UPI000E6ADEFD|nr:lysophospholipid acyltransferase family protein [Indioceanicola profundi]